MMTVLPPRTAGYRWRALAVAGLLAAALAWGGSPARAATAGPPTSTVSWSVRVIAPTAIRTEPDPRSASLGILRTTAPFTGGPMILLVLDQRTVDGREWTRVLLPRRPNGTSGWVISDVLRFRENPMRIVIDQSERRTYVYRSGRLVYSTRNAVGKAATPTPYGRFAVAEKVLLPPGGFLGPVVLVTSGYSEKLNEFMGGDGRFAMHGTSLPSLIGTRASNGCIRHRNDAILRISRLVAPGTPIRIRP